MNINNSSSYTERFPRFCFVVLLLLFFPILISTLSGCKGHSSTSLLLPVHVPAAPTGLTAVAENNSVSLAWSSASSATSYVVYRSIVSGATGTKILSSRSTSFVDTGVSNENTYFYSVRAVNSAGVSDLSGQVSATPSSLVSSATVTVAALVQYQDKEYDVNGFTGKRTYMKVRFATIEVLDGSGDVVATGTTGSDGSYITSIPTSTTSSFYVRVHAEAACPGNTVPIQIKNLSDQVYAVRGNDFVPSGTVNVALSVSALSIGGAFNVLDVFTNGFEFVNNLASYPSDTLTGYWQPGNNYGTYYWYGGIYILNTLSDTDEYDDDVLYHEFGHFVAANFSRDDSPGGIHFFGDDDLDMRLAWSEGWGDAMPGNIKKWLNYSGRGNLLSSSVLTPLTEYIDTNSGGVGLALNMGNPDGIYLPYYYYACNEVAIAKILLDVNQNFGMHDVWDVISSYTSSIPSSDINLEVFWDRWHSLGKDTTAPSAITLNSIFESRQIFYSLDAFDPDDPLINAKAYTGPQVHYLYDNNDADYVSFAAINGHQYTITTSNLKNGADTIITLYGTNGVEMSSNDNSNNVSYTGALVPSGVASSRRSICETFQGIQICHDNGFDILGSRLVTPVLSSGTYYVSVKSSSGRPKSAGRYGTYTLKIQ